MLRCDRPAPDGDGRTHEFVDRERLEGSAAADDVGYRVDGADLVEVHVLHVDSVYRRLGRGEFAEDGEGAIADGIGQRRRCKERTDRVPGAWRLVARGYHRHVLPGDAAPNSRLDEELGASRKDGVYRGLDGGEVGSGVDERAEELVAGHA